MTQVHDARPCGLGEGPLWHPKREQLFWFDITAGKLLSRDGSRALEWQFDEMVSAAGWVDADTLLIASETALFTFNLVTERIEVVVPLEEEMALTRSNDGRADPWGGFWIGTMGKQAEPDAGSIYRLYSGQIRRIFTDLTITNAISFAPDRSVAYFTDSVTRKVLAQPLGEEGWPEGAPRLFVDLGPEDLIPDGAVTDANGNLWIAQWGAGRVAVHGPDGSFLRAVEVGAKRATCPAFGGADFGTLFVTSARDGLDAAELAADPLAGQVFATKPGAQGLPEPRVRL